MWKKYASAVLGLAAIGLACAMFPFAKGAIRRALTSPRPAYAEFGEESNPETSPAAAGGNGATWPGNGEARTPAANSARARRQ